jgi:large subunit ribosomal protein L17
MRHRIGGRQLGRNSGQRRALYRSQLISLFTHGRIRTTEAKAKELRPMAEHVITIARKGDNTATRSHAMSILANQAVVDRLFEDIGPHFVDRPGGYTRIFKLGVRPGDGATVCQIELIDL